MVRRNFRWLFCRDYRGEHPPFMGTRASEKGKTRMPLNERLGCSKCRYSYIGCNSCGFEPAFSDDLDDVPLQERVHELEVHHLFMEDEQKEEEGGEGDDDGDDEGTPAGGKRDWWEGEALAPRTKKRRN